MTALILRSIAVPVALLLLAATAWADTGDIDRPDAPGDATLVALGEYQGELGGSDTADWYHLLPPAGSNLRVEITMPNGPRLDLVWLWEGKYEVGAAVSPAGDGSGTVSFARELRERDVVIGLESRDAQAVAYVVRFVAAPSPDFALSNLVVTPVPTQTAVGDVDTQTERLIDLDVANHGLAEGSADLLVVATTSQGGHSLVIARVPLQLAPGGSRHIQVRWSTLDTGAVGDARILAWAWPAMDSDRTNNEAEARTYSVAEGTGRSLMLTASIGNCWFSVVNACAHVGFSPGWIVAGASVHALGETNGGWIIASRQGVAFVEP